MARLFFLFWLMVLPNIAYVAEAHAGDVLKDSAIHYGRDLLKNKEGKVFALEDVYIGGGADGTVSFTATGIRGFALRELIGKFVLKKGDAEVRVHVIPLMGGRDQEGRWHPALGHWAFKHSTVNTYQEKVLLGNGISLDIAYQDTRMERGNRSAVLHYGLSVHPNEKTKALSYLAQMTPYKMETPAFIHYQFPDNVIIVQMSIDENGELSFVPVLEHKFQKDG